MLDELINFALQVWHGVEGAAADGALRDQPEPALYLVEPGGVRRSVVQMKARTIGEPGFDPGMFMSAVVVDDQMDSQMLRNIRFNVAQKTQELLMPMPSLALRKDLAIGDIQGGEQGRGAMANVVVGVSDFLCF